MGHFLVQIVRGSYICTSLTFIRNFSLQLLNLVALMQFTYPPVVPLYLFMMCCETEDED